MKAKRNFFITKSPSFPILQGEDEMEGGKVEDRAEPAPVPPVEGLTEEEQRERAERKRKSLAAQRRFRERLERRLHGGTSTTTSSTATTTSSEANTVRQRASAAAEPPQAAAAAPLAAPRGPSQRRREAERANRELMMGAPWGWTDYAICALVLGIGLILFRRLNWLMGGNGGAP